MTVGKRQYHHGDLRRALLGAAREEIDRTGTIDISLRGIARKVGVDPAAVYRHFAAKDDLLASLASEAFEELAIELEKVLGGPKDRMIGLGVAYISFATRNPARFGMMFDLAGRLAHDTVRGASEDGRDPYEILSDGWNALVPDETESDRAISLRQLWSTVHGFAVLVNQGLIPGGPDEIRTQAQEMCARVIDGLTRAS